MSESKYYSLHCDVIGRSLYWKHFESPPGHNLMVWGFIPDLGNEDEGYGEVIPVMWDTFKRKYFDEYRREVHPLLWVDMNRPETPFIHEDRNIARQAAIDKITKQ